jgi:DNA polymerase III subunit theta
MSFNLCDLLPDDKALIEVDKAAAYAVWKERNGQLAKAEMDGGAFKDQVQSQTITPPAN